MNIFAIVILVGLLVFTIFQGKQLYLIIKDKRKNKKAVKEVATPVEEETKSNNDKECDK